MQFSPLYNWDNSVNFWMHLAEADLAKSCAPQTVPPSSRSLQLNGLYHRPNGLMVLSCTFAGTYTQTLKILTNRFRGKSACLLKLESSAPLVFHPTLLSPKGIAANLIPATCISFHRLPTNVERRRDHQHTFLDGTFSLSKFDPRFLFFLCATCCELSLWKTFRLGPFWVLQEK